MTYSEAKSAENLRVLGFDFAYAALVFEGPILEMDDNRKDYGEKRLQVIGQVDDILFVVFTWRGDVRRIISARLANRRERDACRQVFG